jgi:hypothetical protein
MNKEDFVFNHLNYSKTVGFSFLKPNQQFDDPKKLSQGMQTIMSAMMSAGFGVLIGSGVGYGNHSKDELVADLQRMNEYCNLIGLNLEGGICSVQLVIDGDELSFETLIGRFSMIHERIYSFRKYSMVIMKNWIFGNTTCGTHAQVVIYFSSSKKAQEFHRISSKQCTHTDPGKQVYTFPVVVDLEDKATATHRLGYFYEDKYRASVFKKRI